MRKAPAFNGRRSQVGDADRRLQYFLENSLSRRARVSYSRKPAIGLDERSHLRGPLWVGGTSALLGIPRLALGRLRHTAIQAAEDAEAADETGTPPGWASGSGQAGLTGLSLRDKAS